LTWTVWQSGNVMVALNASWVVVVVVSLAVVGVGVSRVVVPVVVAVGVLAFCVVWQPAVTRRTATASVRSALRLVIAITYVPVNG
jgi:hypothetical protein